MKNRCFNHVAVSESELHCITLNHGCEYKPGSTAGQLLRAVSGCAIAHLDATEIKAGELTTIGDT